MKKFISLNRKFKLLSGAFLVQMFVLTVAFILIFKMNTIQDLNRLKIIPTSAVAYITNSVSLVGTDNVDALILTKMGTGAIINIDGDTKILTAGHVCSIDVVGIQAVLGTSLAMSSSLEIKTVDGKTIEGTIVKIDEEKDLCLISIKEKLSSPIDTGYFNIKNYPHKIFTLSFPQGVYMKDMALIFEGFFGGCDEDFCYFTLPATSGSSGSPIMTSDFKLIGIILATRRDFNEIVRSPSPESLREFLTNL